MRRVLREAQPCSEPVCEQLHQWLIGHRSLRTIAAFAALPGEVDLSSFIARHPHIRWAFPRVSGEKLIFHQVRNPASELVGGNFNILEPSPTLPEITTAEIDAFLCPGLAFDSTGGRLGRGKGFYDRILTHARPNARKIGVCFPFQQVPDTFPEPHDVPMDTIICG